MYYEDDNSVRRVRLHGVYKQYLYERTMLTTVYMITCVLLKARKHCATYSGAKLLTGQDRTGQYWGRI